jgi:hypothetical protein
VVAALQTAASPMDPLLRSASHSGAASAAAAPASVPPGGFIRALRRGVVILAESWGWDVLNSKPIDPKALRGSTAAQRWANWPVRLYKAGRCMQVFEQKDLFQGLRAYALWLQAKNARLNYENRSVLEWWEDS